MIALTMGDPNGVGPEIILKALQKVRSSVVVVGSRKVFEFYARKLAIDFPFSRVTDGHIDLDRVSPDELILLDIGLDDLEIKPGRLSPDAGRLALACLEKAVDLALSKKISAVVTAPVSKEAVIRAGIEFTGHTEYLARRSGMREVYMLLFWRKFSVVHATTHIPLSKVSRSLSISKIVKSGTLAIEFLQKLGMTPKVGIACLNPHCGEGGEIGVEEQKFIFPAFDELRKRFPRVVIGCFPADTVYNQALSGKLNLVVAMYHDQGHIPMKLLAFSEAVNVTLGLPFVRTSVDHGTAFDIAGKGIADPSNLVEAAKLAIRISKEEV
ncbi:MAG: 4-hydroxythreonine-4-phosphate dehydrogenase PdxA [Thermotogae bacterium]|nr:4-hydroxythreonine-4-phosphate dehydrogenase PdxA [Thermotogota bacterium]